MRIKNILSVIFLAIFGITQGYLFCCDKNNDNQQHQNNNNRNQIRDEILKHLDLYKNIIDFVLNKNEQNTQTLEEECKEFNNNYKKQYTSNQYKKIREKIVNNKDVAKKFAEKIEEIKTKVNQEAAKDLKEEFNELFEADTKSNKHKNQQYATYEDAEKLVNELNKKEDIADDTDNNVCHDDDICNIIEHKKLQNAIESEFDETEVKEINEITSAIEKEEKEYKDLRNPNEQQVHHKVPLNQFGMSIKNNMILLSEEKHKQIHNNQYHRKLYPTDITYEHYKESNIPAVNARHKELENKIQSFRAHNEVQSKHKALNAFEKDTLHHKFLLIKLNNTIQQNCNANCILCKNGIHNKYKVCTLIKIIGEPIKQKYSSIIRDSQFFKINRIQYSKSNPYVNMQNNVTQQYNCVLSIQFTTYYILEHEIIIYTKIICKIHNHCVADIWIRIEK